MSNNEELLIKKCVQGDLDAFEELIKDYEKKVYNIALRMLGNSEDAYDVAQEVFIKIYKSLKNFKGQASFSTWLYRITKNVCIDHIRKRKKVKTYSIDEPLQLNHKEIKIDVEDKKGQTPLEKIERYELRSYIENSIENLNETHRLMIVLRDINGYSYDEIAKITESSLGTVKSRISRARNALKKILEKNKELINEFNV